MKARVTLYPNPKEHWKLNFFSIHLTIYAYVHRVLTTPENTFTCQNKNIKKNLKGLFILSVQSHTQNGIPTIFQIFFFFVRLATDVYGMNFFFHLKFCEGFIFCVIYILIL